MMSKSKIVSLPFGLIQYSKEVISGKTLLMWLSRLSRFFRLHEKIGIAS